MGSALFNVRAAELRDDVKLLGRFRAACTEKLFAWCPADLLFFFAAAEHAMDAATSSPGGLFRAVVRDRAWCLITEGQEARAHERLRALKQPKSQVRARLASPSPIGHAAEPARLHEALEPVLARVLPCSSSAAHAAPR